MAIETTSDMLALNGIKQNLDELFLTPYKFRLNVIPFLKRFRMPFGVCSKRKRQEGCISGNAGFFFHITRITEFINPLDFSELLTLFNQMLYIKSLKRPKTCYQTLRSFGIHFKAIPL